VCVVLKFFISLILKQ